MDFDRYSAKNAAMGRAWDLTDDKKKEVKHEHKPAEPKMGICEGCKKETLVRPHRSRQTDIENGAASFGVVVHYYCENCYPKSRRNQDVPPPMSAKQVKNLLRGAKKGLF